MNLAKVAQMTVRGSGVLLIVLGILFWTGRAEALQIVHILLGLLLVVALWTLAFLAGRAGVNLGLVALAVVLGLVMPVLGLTQKDLLSGDGHWVIQVVHLLVGLAAIGLAERLGAAIKTRAAAPV